MADHPGDLGLLRYHKRSWKTVEVTGPVHQEDCRCHSCDATTLSQSTQKTMQVPEILCLDQVIQHLVPTIHTVQKMVEVPRSQLLGGRADGDAATNSKVPEGDKNARDPPDTVH